ncbi:unnamed protein product [Cladocopium goreaui]|uniref:Uncharacterized protein n=1 Tax=Cladocopium goreaui TaxID=2562237 RepID=A0A9P1BR13_9DINO|nr:unnamed protein product [Cladocopium goreaui]|mmetsp:Transcript_75303/g.166373  ORF Transcript_75303/g.166373 Transcript_75303/m.166373 type:complete len:133 (+) Transcript_75303:84-482(+)
MALNRASWHFLTQKKPQESHQDSLSLFLLGVRTNPKSFEDFIHRSRNETFPEFFFLEDPKSFEEALGEDPNIKAMRRLRSFGTLKHCESEKPLGGNPAVLQSFAGSIARRDPSNGRVDWEASTSYKLWDKPA